VQNLVSILLVDDSPDDVELNLTAQVLAEMKADPNLSQIPVVILTTSQAEEDIVRSYDLGANCYISQPVDLAPLIKVAQAIDQFWFGIVQLPRAK